MLVVAVAYVVVLLTHGQTAPEPDRPPPGPAPASSPSSDTCGPAVTSYPDGSRWYRCAPTTPPPAELPSADPFSEE